MALTTLIVRMDECFTPALASESACYVATYREKVACPVEFVVAHGRMGMLFYECTTSVL